MTLTGNGTNALLMEHSDVSTGVRAFWTLTGYPYVLNGLGVTVSGTLTIPPGTDVRYHPGSVFGGASFFPVLTIGTGGTLIAQGTAAQPITFASFGPPSS